MSWCLHALVLTGPLVSDQRHHRFVPSTTNSTTASSVPNHAVSSNASLQSPRNSIPLSTVGVTASSSGSVISSLHAPGTPSSATNSTDKGEPDLLPVLTPSVILATASAPASYQSPNFNLTREGFKQLVFRALKESVFPKCKFITRDEELHHAGSIARVVMKEFGLKDCTDPAAIRWWANTKGLVRNRLTAHRNNRMSTMGHCYKSKKPM